MCIINDDADEPRTVSLAILDTPALALPEPAGSEQPQAGNTAEGTQGSCDMLAAGHADASLAVAQAASLAQCC